MSTHSLSYEPLKIYPLFHPVFLSSNLKKKNQEYPKMVQGVSPNLCLPYLDASEQILN